MGLLPEAHVHAAGDRPLVHRHLISETVAHSDTAAHHHDSAVEHDGSHDHADARPLKASFNVGGHFAPFGPPATASWLTTAARQSRPSPLIGKTLLPTHDPPLRFTSSPAPPAAR